MKIWALLLLVAAATAKHEQYIGWKSYYLGPASYEQLQTIARLQIEHDVDILSHPIVEREGLVLVRPEVHDAFLKALEQEGIAYRIHREDVKAALDQDDENIERRRRENIARNGKEMPYDNYQPLSVIYDYIDSIAANYPETVTLVTPAHSFEGRPIKLLKISTTNFEDERKPVIFLDATIHAREWITPPTMTYAIHKLVVNVTEPELLERFDWIILPMVNPDGYDFSFYSFRFWRKTRSTDQHPLSLSCPGVDGNRNYDFFWNTVGVSASPCSDVYPGNRPFSEVETRVVRDVIDEYLHRMAMYITMHSYGSMILYPWGHDGTLSHNAFALHTVAIAMADAIFANQLPHFPRYVVGNPVLVLGYPASGASEDYAHLIGVPISYTYELPGLSGGQDGFHLAPQYIEQVAKETWEGLAIGAIRAGDLFVPYKK